MKKILLLILLSLFLIVCFLLYKIYPNNAYVSDSLTNCKVWKQECNTCSIIVENEDTVSAGCTKMGCIGYKGKQLTCLEYFKDDELNLRCKARPTDGMNGRASGYYFSVDGTCKKYPSNLLEWPFKSLEECQNTCG